MLEGLRDRLYSLFEAPDWWRELYIEEHHRYGSQYLSNTDWYILVQIALLQCSLSGLWRFFRMLVVTRMAIPDVYGKSCRLAYLVGVILLHFLLTGCDDSAKWRGGIFPICISARFFGTEVIVLIELFSSDQIERSCRFLALFCPIFLFVLRNCSWSASFCFLTTWTSRQCLCFLQFRGFLKWTGRWLKSGAEFQTKTATVWYFFGMWYRKII